MEMYLHVVHRGGARVGILVVGVVSKRPANAVPEAVVVYDKLVH
jgi:hypothetical protein